MLRLIGAIAVTAVLGTVGAAAQDWPNRRVQIIVPGNLASIEDSLLSTINASDALSYPLAAGNVPPSTDPRLYEPLADVRLPEGTHFVAGFTHHLDVRFVLEDGAQALADHRVIVGQKNSCRHGYAQYIAGIDRHRTRAQ